MDKDKHNENYTQKRIKECVRKMKLAQINFKFAKAELKIWLDDYDKKEQRILMLMELKTKAMQEINSQVENY